MNRNLRKNLIHRAAGTVPLSNRVGSDSRAHTDTRADTARTPRRELTRLPSWRGSGFSVATAAVMIGLMAFPGQGRQTAFAGETLYNGIRLSVLWPPHTDALTLEPVVPPYLLSPPAVIPIDVGRQLFVDDFLIEHTTLKRSYHVAKYHPASPVLKPDKPWEREGGKPTAMVFSDGVWYDPAGKLFKMWYMGGYTTSTCYATSRDGIHWDKPVLDVVPGTNIVMRENRDSNTVWLDLRETDPQRRYKLFTTMRRKENRGWVLALFCSADGIHWGNPVATSAGIGDRTTVFYNPFRQVWVYSLRTSYTGMGRSRFYVEHADAADGLSWTNEDRYLWTAADRLDPHNPNPDLSSVSPQLYNLDAVAYESILLGLFSIWQGDPRITEKRNELLLGFSRDGFHWHRPDRRPFAGVDESEGAWNWGNVQSAGGGCLVVGDELYFYVSGRGKDRADAHCTTGLAILRRDGFASMDAGEAGGTLTTRTVRFQGSRLFVNADVSGGELRVEVLDREGQTVAPFSRENCAHIRGDSTRQAVTWQGASDLSSLAGRPVKFRFHLTNGRLYAFWVSPDPSGASHGYVAAGGPGFTGPTDTVGAATSREDSAQ